MIGTRQRLGLGAVLAATFMSQVDGFIVNVASPSIQADLAAGFDEIQLVGAAYVVAFGALLITGARLGDRVGHRTVFCYGVAGFTAASLLCGVATSAEMLIAFRFLQGAAAAFMAPQVLAIIRATVPDEEQRAKVIGWYGVVIGMGVICGIAGGGILVHLDIAGLGWRPVLLVNVPIGVAILALSRLVPRSATNAAYRLDVTGAALTMVGLPALLISLVFGPGGAWWLWLGVVLAGVVVAALVAQQRALHRRGGAPLFPAHVVTARGMRLSLFTVALFFATNSGLYLVFTYYLQTGLRLDQLTAGLVFVPLGLGFSFGSAICRRIGHRLPAPAPVAGCVLLTAMLLAGAAIAQAPPSAQPVMLVAMIALAGVGQGLIVAPLVAGILSRVGPADAGAASGIATTVTQVGLALGVAVSGVWYRTALGAVPGDPGVPLADHSAAFAAATGLLALLATATGVISARLHRLSAPPKTTTGSEETVSTGAAAPNTQRRKQ